MTKDDKFRNISEGIVGVDNNNKSINIILDENIDTHEKALKHLHEKKLNDFKRTKEEFNNQSEKEKRKYRNMFRLHKEQSVTAFLQGKKIITYHNEKAAFIYKDNSYTLKDLLEEFIEYLYLKEK
jgi:selenocysteine lyase/cysteine desulfurase